MGLAETPCDRTRGRDHGLDPEAIYRNQTAILVWLRLRGHAVHFVRDPDHPRPRPAVQQRAVAVKPNSPLLAFLGQPCPYCTRVMTRHMRSRPSRDHVDRPRRHGGKLIGHNRLIVCQQCNGDKADFALVAWHAVLVAKSDPRAPVVGALIREREMVLPSTRNARMAVRA